MAFHQNRSKGRQDRAEAVVAKVSLAWHIKNFLDVVLATAGLVLLSPLIVLVGVAIKLESSGPIFCREIQYGYANQAISALKFRSTMSGTEATCIRSRVTRVGRVLRSTGIDELPQLLNVLLGPMSIVGLRAWVRQQEFMGGHPRPLLKNFKPGLTGWTQIVEARKGRITAEQRIAEDLRYVRHSATLRADERINWQKGSGGRRSFTETTNFWTDTRQDHHDFFAV